MSNRALSAALGALLAGLGWFAPARAALPIYDVFLGAERGETALFFVDARSGLSRVISADGTHHTLLASGVIFEERETGIIRIATPDGRVEAYTLMPATGAEVAVDWVVSPDRMRIAWAHTEQRDGALSSDLYVSDINGLEKRLALHTSSTQGIGALPLAVTNDGATLFYTRLSDPFSERPDSLAVETVTRLDVASAQSSRLPDGVDCPCIAGFTPDGRIFARLGREFGLEVWNLALPDAGGASLQPPRLRAGQAGYVLLSSDGDRALYTVADSAGRSALVLAEIAQATQRVLASNLRDPLRPVLLESAYAVVVGIDRPGTYKIALGDGTLTQISAYTWLGQLN